MTEPDDMTQRLDIPADVELEAPFSEEAVTPVHRICPDCTRDQAVLDNDVMYPEEAVEAWKLITCRGTADWRLWRWCFVHGEVTRPRDGVRTSFDRRKARR